MCEAIDEFADWQWNVNPWGKQDNPGTAISHYLLYPDRVDRPEVRDTAFAWLLYGQRHNPAALRTYHACRRHGDEHLFWAVVCSAGGRDADLAEAAVHLEWQLHSDPLSLVDALACWRNGGDHQRIAAASRLLSGQWHNANAGQLYRACLAILPGELFAEVEALADRLAHGRLVHPYLRGEEPSALHIRDEVPRSRATE